MIEEINHALNGGLYGELIQNRVFQNDPNVPVNWSAVQENGGAGSIVLDTTQPISGTVLTTSLKVSITQAGKVGAANDGYWGIPVKPNTSYNASFYAKASGLTGPLNVSIESIDGSVVYAQAQVPTVTADWVQYSVTLATGAVTPTENTRFVISVGTTGTLWLNQVSLFPPTYRERANGNRIATTGGSKFYESVSKDTQTGTIYIKGVNAAGQAQKVNIVLDGISGVSPQGTATVLTSSSPQDTNTLTQPTKVVPVTSKAKVSGNFEFSFAPYSVTVLAIETK
jgi:hypothetical protein